MADISIVLITYYTGDVLFKCIESCFKFHNIKEIIVLNNGNKPEVVHRLEELEQANSIKFLTGHGNIGFAKACNLGAFYASGKYVLFLNPDCYSDDPYVVTKMSDALENNPQYWMASCLILNSDGSIQKTCRRNLLNLCNSLSESFGLTKFGFHGLNKPVSQITDLPEISEVPAISGAVMMVSRERYMQLGGIDEGYFLHVEDMDFCRSLTAAGGKICFVKNAVLTHDLSTSDTTNKFLEWHKARGFIYYLQKHFSYCNLPLIKQMIALLIWIRYFIKISLSKKK